MTRNELKSLIKECLVEILTEGSNSSSARPAISTRTENVQRRPTQQQQTVAQRVAQNTSVQQRRPAQQSQTPRQNRIQEVIEQHAADINESVSHLAGADNIVTPEQQIMAEGDAAAKIALRIKPDEIFGADEIAKWSQMFL